MDPASLTLVEEDRAKEDGLCSEAYGETVQKEMAAGDRRGGSHSLERVRSIPFTCVCEAGC